jgi:questin oxidase-like protein
MLTSQIPHHILSLFGTGASASTIQASYDQNANYQRSAQKTHPGVADALAADWAAEAPKNLGNGSRYADFLLFFQREIERAGDFPNVRSGHLSAHEAVLNEFLFKGDSRAEDMLQRMFAGFLHPIIQLMFGVEWSQPAIVAEALAQAAVHKNNLKEFLEEAESRARASPSGAEAPSIAELYERIGTDDKLRKAPRMSDANKIHDGILVRAPEEMYEIVKHVRVREDEVDEKTAEMFEMAVWMAAGAALRPGKMAKWDFFLMQVPALGFMKPALTSSPGTT